MNPGFIGFTLDVLGKIILGLTVILTHHKIVEEHRIDKKVLFEMKREQIMGILGIVLILVGYLLQLPLHV